jgi:hypothetical protein
MKVAVLGCGPAGLLAAHAAVLDDHDVDILSIPIRSELPGTMYLHRSIPFITSAEPDATITYLKLGQREGYAAKVYKDPAAPCSWDKFKVGPAPAWNLREAYLTLWNLYRDRVTKQVISPLDVPFILHEYERVISTIPARQLCRKPYHRFRYAAVFVGSESLAEPDNIVYSGLRDHAWYRTSNLFGHQATEYGRLLPGLRRGIKPTETNCDCWRGRVLRVGRFGTWNKNHLTHHAFEHTQDYLRGEMECCVPTVAK